MRCALCASVNETEFTAEMMIHFGGINHLNNPGVLTFPSVRVCMDCGFSELTLPDEVLDRLKQGLTTA